MKLFDGYRLAKTKFHSRRVRISITAGVCAVLFSVLFGAGFVVQGASRTEGQIAKQGFNSHYIAVARSMAQNNSFTSKQKEVQDQMDNELRGRKVVVTDALRSSEAYQNELLRRQSALLNQDYEQIEASYITHVQATYKPTSTYKYREVAALNNGGFINYPGQSDVFLQQQKEQIETGISAEQQANTATAKARINPAFAYTDKNLLKPLVMPDQNLDWTAGQPYPVVIPQTLLLRLTGTSLAHQSAKQQLAIYKRLDQAYDGKTLSYCYRNTTAQSQLISVLQYNKSAASNNKITPLDVSSCTGFDQAILKKDSIIVSNSDDTQKALFPVVTQAPVTKSLQFKVVGYVPTVDPDTPSSPLTGFINSVNDWGPNLFPAIIPAEVYAHEPLFTGDTSAPVTGATSASQVFFDFPNRAAQKQYIASGCQGMTCYSGNSWQVASFGNLKVALEGAIGVARRIVLIVAIVIGGLATLLTISAISRIVSDSRREIAVFRSLGARGRDILQIYLTYGCMISALSIFVAVTVGVFVALFASIAYSTTLALNMSVAIGAVREPLQVTLFGMNLEWMLVLAVIMVSASCIGVAISLLVNNRRNLMQLTKED